MSTKTTITYEEAVAAYQRYCNERGFMYQQPAFDSSEPPASLVKEAESWELHNANGLLATVSADGIGGVISRRRARRRRDKRLRPCPAPVRLVV
jgi:hypothetical protein